MNHRVRTAAFSTIIILSGCTGGGGGESGPVAGVSPPPNSPPSSPPSPPSPPPAPPPAPPSPPPPAASTASGGIAWGVNGHPLVSYPGVSWEDQVRLVAETGATQYRIDVRSDHAPADLARLADIGDAHGVDILPVLTPTIDLDNTSTDEIYRRSYDFAFSFGKALGGRIPVWELGNEMENYAILQPCEMRDDGTQYPCEWGPASGDGVLHYHGERWSKVSAALDGMSDGMRAADPGAIRAMGTAGWGHTHAFDRMAQDGIEWDISVWHHYGDPDSSWAFDHLSTFGKPIWITEFNGEAETGGAVQTSDVRAKMRWYQANSQKYDIQAAHFYELLDESYWTGYESVMGLYRLEKQPNGGWALGAAKPVHQTFKAEVAGGG